jgi:hypothetical protein
MTAKWLAPPSAWDHGFVEYGVCYFDLEIIPKEKLNFVHIYGEYSLTSWFFMEI